MRTELRNELNRLGRTLTGFGQRFYYEVAKQTAVRPYAVFFNIQNVPTRETGKTLEETFVQVNFVGTVLADLEAAEDELRKLWDDGNNFDIVGYKLAGNMWDFTGTPVRDTAEKVWTIPMQYRFLIEPN